MGFHRGKVKTVVCTAYVCVPQVQCAMHCCGTWVVLGMASLTAVEATGCEKKEESERARESVCIFFRKGALQFKDADVLVELVLRDVARCKEGRVQLGVAPAGRRRHPGGGARRRRLV